MYFLIRFFFDSDLFSSFVSVFVHQHGSYRAVWWWRQIDETFPHIVLAGDWRCRFFLKFGTKIETNSTFDRTEVYECVKLWLSHPHIHHFFFLHFGSINGFNCTDRCFSWTPKRRIDDKTNRFEWWNRQTGNSTHPFFIRSSECVCVCDFYQSPSSTWPSCNVCQFSKNNNKTTTIICYVCMKRWDSQSQRLQHNVEKWFEWRTEMTLKRIKSKTKSMNKHEQHRKVKKETQLTNWK